MSDISIDKTSGNTFYRPETPANTPRLSRQVVRVQDLMRDGVWRTLLEISITARCSEASASARLRDLRKPQFGAYNVERRKTGLAGLYEYRIGPDEFRA